MKTNTEITYPKLRGKMAENGYTFSRMENELGISHASFYRKMAKIVPFTIFEIITMMKIFNCKFEEIFRMEDFENVRKEKNRTENPSDERKTAG